jgi:hypothetical protein
MERWLPFAPRPSQTRLACAGHGSVTVFDLARL